MKALIFTMTCGEGHNMIAKAVAAALKARGCVVETAQTYGYDARQVKRQNSLLLFAWNRIPKLYDFFWNRLRQRDYYRESLPSYLIKCKDHFVAEIERFRPDVIVCTHYYAGSVVAYLKRQGMIDEKILTAGIVTDFCLAPYWERCKGLDIIFSPVPSVDGELLKKGFKRDSIATVGLPIRSEFFKEYDADEYKRRTGLDGKRVVLVAGGGFGLGNGEKLVGRLLKRNLNATIVVVNGRNERSKRRIDALVRRKCAGNVLNLGFIENLIDYLRASDVVVTRCGSSAVSEIIALKKPFIIREKLIINERINKELLVEAGCAFGMERLADVGGMTEFLLNNPAAREKMTRAQEKFGYPDPAAAVAEYLMGRGGAYGGQ